MDYMTNEQSDLRKTGLMHRENSILKGKSQRKLPQFKCARVKKGLDERWFGFCKLEGKDCPI